MTDADDKTLWLDLKALLRVVGAIFGGPVDLWEQAAVEQRAARLLRAWLRALERIARALLLAMAARLPADAKPRTPLGRAASRPRGAAAPQSDLPRAGDAPPETPPPEQWAGVAFRVLPPAAGSGAPSGAPHHFVFIRALAFRFEALIRVARSPEPYARRLARRLRATPGLAERVLRPGPACDDRPAPCEELADLASALAWAAVGALTPETG
jgi:hypothetical protein